MASDTSGSQKSAITPHLTVRDTNAAIAFYKEAFGAKEIYRMPNPEGTCIWHAEVEINGASIFLNDEFPDANCLSPTTLNGSPVTIHLDVDDADAWFEQAVKAGATVTMPLEDAFWGDRYGKFADPFGHHWSISTPIPNLSPEEIQQRVAAVMSGAK
ncbi:MAG: VOC family protein [Cyanobacteria bacterium CRU_2_1]|nr:VOC family protein [Cyanobacteria bacterium RU_5_0]NJR60798.1 VOC family protein [Cyanobacteria bacterium CRU_2_1]